MNYPFLLSPTFIFFTLTTYLHTYLKKKKNGNQNDFAVLTACDGKNKTNSAFKLWENSMWFQPSVGGVAIGAHY